MCYLVRYFSALLTEKMIVIFECGKGLVTTECFLGCAKEAILIRCSYCYFIGLFRMETADLVKARTRKRNGQPRGGRGGRGGADHYKPLLAFYCCLHTLALQYRTGSATETVTGTYSFFAILQ